MLHAYYEFRILLLQWFAIISDRKITHRQQVRYCSFFGSSFQNFRKDIFLGISYVHFPEKW